MDKPIPEAVVLAAKQAAYAADPETVLTTAATRAAITAAQQPDHIVDATKMVAQQQGQAAPPSAPVGVDGLIEAAKAAESMLRTVNECVSHECEDCREYAGIHAKHLRDALAQQPAAVDDAMVSEIAKKLRKLRLTEVSGRKENQSTTVKECLKAGLGGLYDDEAAEYIVRAVLRYWEVALAARKKGVGCHGSV